MSTTQKSNKPAIYSNDFLDSSIALYTVEETCKILHLSRSSLYNLMNKRKIISLKQGKNTVFRPCDIQKYINSLEEYKGYASDL